VTFEFLFQIVAFRISFSKCWPI